MEEKTWYIKANGTLVEVPRELYLAYYRSKRRDRYYEHDIKIETAIYDKYGNITGYAPSKEDSLDRIIETGEDFVDEDVDVESAAISDMMSGKLHEALALLTDSERELMHTLFFSNNGGGMSERKYAEISGIPQQTINSRKARILTKIRNFWKVKKSFGQPPRPNG